MSSTTPIRWKVGVDEAGRGPVIGPMVMCALAVPEDREHELKDLGARDSKQLSKQQRDDLFAALSKYPHAIVELTAEDITRAMRQDISINELEARFAGQVLMELYRKQPFDTVLLDSPDRPPEKYAARVKKYFPLHKPNPSIPTRAKGVEVLAENYADAAHPSVSAASILAKVTRDAKIDEIKKIAGWDFGSGYPHEMQLVEQFLQRHYDDPKLAPFIRWEWMTVKKFERAHRKTPTHGGGLGDYLE